MEIDTQGDEASPTRQTPTPAKGGQGRVKGWQERLAKLREQKEQEKAA
jgi:hypothetical protein